MRQLFAAGLTLAMTASSYGQPAQRPLPKIEYGVASQEGFPGVATVSFGDEHSRSPLRIRLIAPPRKGYRHLDEVPFEVSLENTTQNAIVLPWSPAHMSFGSDIPASYKHMTFDFLLSRRGKRDWLLARYQLSGSENGPPDEPRFKTLMPGERIVVKVPVILIPGQSKDDDDAVAHPSGGKLKLGVRFDAPGDPLARSFGARLAENDIKFDVLPTIAAVPSIPPSRQAPLVTRVIPDVASPGMTIRIDGYRLGADRAGVNSTMPPARYFFSNGNTRVPAGLRGPSNISLGDPNTVTQYVTFRVPDDLPPGSWQVGVDLDGVESLSATRVSVTEWQMPHLERLSPERVNPGTLVTITGSYFRPNDSMSGSGPGPRYEPVTPFGTPTATTRSFIVPTTAAEGEHTVSLQVFKPGSRSSTPSEPLRYVVQFSPLAPSLRSQASRAMGRGQWMLLEGMSSLQWSERTEVEFSQGAMREMIETRQPHQARVRIPEALAPGSVSVRVRIWHGDIASGWSDSATYGIALNPVPPAILGLFVGKTQQRVLLTGPSPATRFDAMTGDRITVSGNWPVVEDTEIPISLERRGESMAVTTRWSGPNNVDFTVPNDISGGPWTIRIGAAGGAPALTLPISMYVH